MLRERVEWDSVDNALRWTKGHAKGECLGGQRTTTKGEQLVAFKGELHTVAALTLLYHYHLYPEAITYVDGNVRNTAPSNLCPVALSKDLPLSV